LGVRFLSFLPKPVILCITIFLSSYRTKKYTKETIIWNDWVEDEKQNVNA
jgi:hypothetical protein